MATPFSTIKTKPDMLPPPPLTAIGDPNPTITDPFDLRKPLDNYVKGFAPSHGYSIIVGHSGRTPIIYTNYECHRSGKPAKRKVKKDINPTNRTISHSTNPESNPETELSNFLPPKKTRSIKIGCPFKMKACFHKEKRAWTLIHVTTTHNHGPYNFDISSMIPTNIVSQVSQLIPSVNIFKKADQQSLYRLTNQSISHSSQNDEMFLRNLTLNLVFHSSRIKSFQ